MDNLIGATIVLNDEHPDDPANQGVIRGIYMKSLRYNWLGRVIDEQPYATYHDASGELEECPLISIRLYLPKVVLPIQGLGPNSDDIEVTHVVRVKVPPHDPRFNAP